MLKDIPTYLIAGPLGAGKTSLIRHLLMQKPAGERWAVLINEFGRIGLDVALLDGGADGVTLAEVAGGCLCCVNGAPFRVGLSRLLRQARPDRLLIEPSGLGHPLELWRQLGEPPWAGVLALQPIVVVLDAAALAAGESLPASQAGALAMAGLLVLNKAESLDEQARARVLERLPARPCHWTRQGELPLESLPGLCAHVPVAARPPTGKVVQAQAELWLDPTRPVCASQARAEGWSIGWRWHPGQRFELDAVRRWLGGLPWHRAKLVLHTEGGWMSGNGLRGEPISWRVSEWRRDSRVELIFDVVRDEAELKAGMQACRLSG